MYKDKDTRYLVSFCNIHNDIMVQTKTSHLGKVRYAIILLGWRYANLTGKKKGIISMVRKKLSHLRMLIVFSDNPDDLESILQELKSNQKH